MAGTPWSRGPPKALLGQFQGPEGPPGAVRHVVDDGGPAPPVRGVGQAAMDGEGVVQHALPGLQPDGHRVEHGQLLGGQDGLDGLQVLEVEVEDGEGRAVPGPGVGAGDVLDAAVRLVLLLEGHVDGEVLHGDGPRPVGVVLVPGNHPPGARGLHKQLVVPQADGHLGWREGRLVPPAGEAPAAGWPPGLGRAGRPGHGGQGTGASGPGSASTPGTTFHLPPST